MDPGGFSMIGVDFQPAISDTRNPGLLAWALESLAFGLFP